MKAINQKINIPAICKYLNAKNIADLKIIKISIPKKIKNNYLNQFLSIKISMLQSTLILMLQSYFIYHNQSYFLYKFGYIPIMLYLLVAIYSTGYSSLVFDKLLEWHKKPKEITFMFFYYERSNEWELESSPEENEYNDIGYSYKEILQILLDKIDDIVESNKETQGIINSRLMMENEISKRIQ